MATGYEGVGLKAVFDALVGLIKKAKNKRLTNKGKKALKEALRELLMAPANLRPAEAKIKVAKAAGIINEDVELAEEWVAKHKAAAKKAAAKKPAAKKKVAAKKPAAKKAAAKKAAAKKPAAKKAAAKKPAAKKKAAAKRT
jgi:hypothetical protein